jgi:hypothetical protein
MELWMNILNAGHKKAASHINKLKTKMTKEQIALSQARASKCYQSNYTDC